MKFSMNGALTIGTLDGANIEIREEVGAENFFLFGLSAQEVYDLKARGYRPMDYYNGSQSLRDVIDLIRSGFFARGDTELFRPLIDGLLYQDPYLLLADFQSYVECQEKVSAAYRDTERWTRMSILNTARGHLARQIRAHPPTHTCGSRNRIVRRSGSAAPQRSWSPTVNADRYSPPIASFRSRPMGTVN
jgi:glucan phosphorylase